MAACLYQENRVSLEPSGFIESVFVPSSGSSAFGSRNYPKRRRVESPALSDEATFAQQHLATESAIFFREDPSAYPRAILWRVLEDSTLLELQSVDIYHELQDTKDAAVTLRFRFDSALIPLGVVFTSKAGPQSAVVVHAITKAGDVITLTLRDEVFIRPKALEEGQGASKWWNTHSPSALKIRQPYRITTWNAGKELYVTLNDGSTVRLQQTETQGWTENILTEATWTTSMRGLFKSQATARYGDNSMGARAACSAMLSPTGALLWTICLDHTLRVWSTTTGRMAHTSDLVDPERDLKQPATNLMDPHSANLIRILPAGGRASHLERYILVTYSPTARLFKIWKVEETDEVAINMTDYNAGFAFRPPIDDLIETVGWQLVDFDIRTPRTNKDTLWTLWVLIRSGSNTHTFSIAFDADDSNKLRRTWSSQWSKVHPGFTDHPPLKTAFDQGVASAVDQGGATGIALVERWIERLLQPRRFSSETLETALNIFLSSNKTKGQHGDAKDTLKRLPLKQRLPAGLNATISSSSFSDDDAFMDHEREIHAQIKAFNGIVEDLQKHRERTVALAFDSATEMPWHVMADLLGPIRSCCDLEIITHNHREYSDQHSFTADTLLLKSLTHATTSNVGVFIHSLRILHASLTLDALEAVQEAVFADVMTSRSENGVDERMQSVWDRSHLEGRISDDTYDAMSATFDRLGGWSALDNNDFQNVLLLLAEALSGRPQRRHLGRYGARSLLSGAQDTLKLEVEILLDIIIVVLFMSCELHQEDLSDTLNAAEVYTSALRLVKERMIVSWLAFHEHNPKLSTGKQAFETGDDSSGGGILLERLCLEQWSTFPTPKESLTQLLTYWCRAWTLNSCPEADFETKIPFILSWILKNSQLELAGSFLRFMPSTTWAKYVTARYHLAAGEYLEASTIFEAIDEDVSGGFHVAQYDSATLLGPDERAYFGDGLARFYLHIIHLYEKADAPSFAGHFAHLAVRQLEAEQSQDASFHRDVVSRLFSASIQTSRFKDAFVATTKQSDLALRRQFLHSFLNTMLATSNIELLIHLPWPNELAKEADAHLADLCTKPASIAPVPYDGLSWKKTTLSSAESTSVPPHRLLYAWRIERNDYRGAAAALWERIEMLMLAQTQGVRGQDVDGELVETYLCLINCLVLVDEKMRWLLVQPFESNAVARKTRFAASSAGATDISGEFKRGTRRIVTVDDVRRDYQAHLDRMADFAAGRYPITLDGGFGDEADFVDEDVYMGGALPAPGTERGGMEVDIFAA